MYFTFRCVYDMGACVHATACSWRSEDSLRESVLSFPVGFKDPVQALGLCSEHLGQVSPLPSPNTVDASCVCSQCPHELPCPQLAASKSLACSFSQAYHPIPFSWVCVLGVLQEEE